jgi:hypothetical protein
MLNLGFVAVVSYVVKPFSSAATFTFLFVTLIDLIYREGTHDTFFILLVYLPSICKALSLQYNQVMLTFFSNTFHTLTQVLSKTTVSYYHIKQTLHVFDNIFFYFLPTTSHIFHTLYLNFAPNNENNVHNCLQSSAVHFSD